MTAIPGPGAGRLTVVTLGVVTVVLAYPWRSITDRWALGIAVAVVLVSLIWWRRRFLTTIVLQRLRVVLGRKPIRHPSGNVRRTGADVVTTALLRVDGGDTELPIGVLTDYLDRYGLICDAVRVTTRTVADLTTTWIGLTFSGARNLPALQGRSPHIPLRQTAESTARRLAGQLRETGWTTTLVDADELPELSAIDARERWRSITDARGYVTAYTIADPRTALTGVSATGAQEIWTVVEIARNSPLNLRAGAAIRTEDRPARSAPVPGMTLIAGRQATALAALHPLSGVRLV
ncbi:type VII secretion protein EccE [Mycolicibacterium sp. P1-5]|uniref:type VII secretion protein EccE n=1 Tax=Mycolicibacterium sp. P1-5 TaxID=2024617 RepID=UPI0011EC4ABD|nr:type VII secretion protein EccE [Mycolicibacterium sp. P1-5]KAA0111303.1 type VII secretion protein EccE [Mycolicibacterium sp. P1-5]